MTRRLALVLALAGLATPPALAQEKLDWATLGRIRDEGFRRSQVMETAGQLTDVHGPRLTGSPQYKAAADWARQQLETWGLANAHLESWAFGRGWSFERCTAHVVSPMSFPLVALPKAWTAGTNGPVRGKVLRVKAETEADVEKLKGQLAGLVLWVGQPRELKGPEDGGVFKRYSEKQLDELEQYQIPGARGGRGPAGPVDREAFLRRRRVQQALEKLYAAEKPLAVVEPSERDANVLRLGGGWLAQEGRPAGGDAARGVGVPVEPRGAPPRAQDRRRGRARREGRLPRGRHERLQRGGRAARDGQEGRGGDARRPPRLLAPRHRRHRQRRRLRRHDGGDPHPEGDRREAEAHRSASACGAARSRASSARAPTSRSTSPRVPSRRRRGRTSCPPSCGTIRPRRSR